ncbi:hypothetical protein F7Q99_39035 [Streptomyces kaniharaensis]|uniref:Uncharacterized protein n=1 Tax=Streptomyces kaniharaensis TaxID=212423 RepID=A0A6N7L5K1_9ACTN|nr:hypothetical protein [Streptomyces kaniharaensis]MQS18028.1 hypothetical protein [Streptomyces kaniharaensis]
MADQPERPVRRPLHTGPRAAAVPKWWAARTASPGLAVEQLPLAAPAGPDVLGPGEHAGRRPLGDGPGSPPAN